MANKNFNNNDAKNEGFQKGNQKRRNSSKRNRRQREDKYGNLKSTTNDPKWYGADPSLVRDSASIPFSWAIGTPIDLENPNLVDLPSGQEFTIPGICTLDVIPCVSRSINIASPLNVASMAVYAHVRYANSGSSVYDAPDLMLYLMSMTQIYSYIAFLQRTYGLATLYSQRNRYMPQALLQAEGVDAKDVQQHLADFRYGINVLINKAAALAVPADMSIFQRHAFLFQNVYTEGPSVKDQLYMYNPRGFYLYDFDQDGAGMLKYVNFTKPTPYTVEELLDFGNNMLSRILYSEDLNIMSGDIIKVYGTAGLIKLVPLNTEYPIVPLYDPMVLEQFKNATVCFNPGGLDVYQDGSKGFLVFQPYVSWQMSNDEHPWVDKAALYAMRTLCEKRMLTTQAPEPTPEVVIELTRLMASGHNFRWNEQKTAGFVDIYPGSEIAANCAYYQYQPLPNGQLKLIAHYSRYADVVREGWKDEVVQYVHTSSVMANFKFHPAQHLLVARKGTTEDAVQFANGYMNFDVDNYAILSHDNILHMHEAALLNELNVPRVAKAY
nr:putative capsid [Marmot picobirnavirus]